MSSASPGAAWKKDDVATGFIEDRRRLIPLWDEQEELVRRLISRCGRQIHRLCDLGAGDGGFAHLVMEVNPHATAVLVDFSAEWCLNCKFFEKTVLHTKPVEQAIATSGAVTMYGDFTKYPPEIEQTIKALGANGVPVIAIFPGDDVRVFTFSDYVVEVPARRGMAGIDAILRSQRHGGTGGWSDGRDAPDRVYDQATCVAVVRR